MQSKTGPEIVQLNPFCYTWETIIMLLIATTTIYDFYHLLILQIIRRLRSSMSITKRFLLHVAMKTYETICVWQLKCAPPAHAVQQPAFWIPISPLSVSALCQGHCQLPTQAMHLESWAQSVTLQLRLQVLQATSLPHLLVRNVQLVSGYLKITLSLHRTEIEVFISNSS